MLRLRRLAPLVVGLLLASAVDSAYGADIVRDSTSKVTPTHTVAPVVGWSPPDASGLSGPDSEISSRVVGMTATDESLESMPEYDLIVESLAATYDPSGDEAVAAASGQSRSSTLLSAIVELPEFGGSWFEPKANLLHVFVTGASANERIAEESQLAGIEIKLEPADYSFAELEEFASKINADRSEDALEHGAYVAGADDSANRVVIAVFDPSYEKDVPAVLVHDPRVVLKVLEGEKPQPAACTTRTACGTPLRGGIPVGFDVDGAGAGSATIQCSEGFNGAAPDGSRWVLTAGHCSNGISTSCPSANCWGHGQQYIGPMREARDQDKVDVARIRKDSSYWGTGGWIYNQFNPESPWAVDDVYTSNAQIPANAAVCFSSRLVNPTNLCGPILEKVSAFRGMPRIDQDVCNTDSGGSVYRPTEGIRVAYAFISHADELSNPGCTLTEISGTGQDTYVSSIPDIYDY